MVPCHCYPNRSHLLFVFPAYYPYEVFSAEYLRKTERHTHSHGHGCSHDRVPCGRHIPDRSDPLCNRCSHYSGSCYSRYHSRHYSRNCQKNCLRSKEVTVKISNSSLISLFACFYYFIPPVVKSYSTLFRIYQKVFFSPFAASIRKSFSSSFLVSSCIGAGSFPDI